MRYRFFIMIICLFPFLSSCFMLNNGNNNEEPSYNTRIAWESDTFVVHHYGYTSIAGSAVYVFGAAESNDDEILLKLDAETGSVIWRTEPFPVAWIIAPKVIGEYVYVFFGSNIIYSFEAETGKLSAIIETVAEININVITHENYLYFGIFKDTEKCLARFDTTLIDRTGNPYELQRIDPEVIWTSISGTSVYAEPVIKDNIIYCLTFAGNNVNAVELAGINMDTKAEVFHKWIDYDKGRTEHPLLIHQDVIYILSENIAAYNLNTGDLLFLKTFSDEDPDIEWYSPESSLGSVYHEGKIYYTNGSSRSSYDKDDLRNIFCINAQTGKLVWSDTPPLSESLGTNPIIYNDKMYVPQGYGLRVYNIHTGKLIGDDKSFCGVGTGRNLLYNDYMITVRCDENTGDGTLVAIKLGG